MKHLFAAVVAFSLVSGMGQVFAGERPDQGGRNDRAVVDQRLVDRAADSSRILDDYMIGSKSIPTSLLAHAQCVVVIPSLVKAGFIWGGKTGAGLASCRTAQGWSNPSFTNIHGGSFGLQAGVSVTELVLVFTSTKAVHQLSVGDLTLGGDASIVIGPMGRDAQAGTDYELQTEIYTYSRSKGLFAGIAFDGSIVTPNNHNNRKMYGPGFAATSLLTTKTSDGPAALVEFSNRLDRYAP